MLIQLLLGRIGGACILITLSSVLLRDEFVKHGSLPFSRDSLIFFSQRTTSTVAYSTTARAREQRKWVWSRIDRTLMHMPLEH